MIIYCMVPVYEEWTDDWWSPGWEYCHPERPEWRSWTWPNNIQLGTIHILYIVTVKDDWTCTDQNEGVEPGQTPTIMALHTGSAQCTQGSVLGRIRLNKIIAVMVFLNSYSIQSTFVKKTYLESFFILYLSQIFHRIFLWASVCILYGAQVTHTL